METDNNKNNITEVKNTEASAEKKSSDSLLAALEYPYDTKLLRRKGRAIKRQLLEKGGLLKKKIAILGGSTTHDIKDMLELFLLKYGIEASFYESEYAQYWQDVMFDNDELEDFAPDIIFIHTSNRNVLHYPEASSTKEEVQEFLQETYNHFEVMWEKIADKYHCPIIQNNFEMPYYRILGNMDAVLPQGRVNFLNTLNQKFYEYAAEHSQFFINDINYQSAEYGLKEWSQPQYWHMYKYSLCIDAIPYLVSNVANIIKAVYGKNKKALALDLDNTLWGGIVGDDGVENLALGQETTLGQAYSEFQNYLKQLKSTGVLLNVISKNEHENAIAGIHHPQMLLTEEDFISIKANWDPKSKNLVDMASELTLLPESFVFVDDNPAEREIVRQMVKGCAIPELDTVDEYISAIDKGGYFESVGLSADDIGRNEMYKKNAERAKLSASFDNIKDYLLSLKMHADIKAFEPVYMQRIAQLTNKSNQFNLTTRRYTQEEIEQTAADTENYITQYGSLTDCFGDNGVVSVVIGQINTIEDITNESVSGVNEAKEGRVLDIILWLMSCRVLKRDMENAMLDTLVQRSRENGVKTIKGYYYPTAKNGMVKDFYSRMGFEMISEDEEGNRVYTLNVESYVNQNEVIEVN